MAGGGRNAEYPERSRNARAERTVIEVVPGPAAYVAGGFTTGVDTSALRQLSRIKAAGVLDQAFLVSGAIGMSGALAATVVSTGISGNQLGIQCFQMFNKSGTIDTSGLSVVREVPASSDLHLYTIKVLCQGH